jgi:hypothetical protein
LGGSAKAGDAIPSTRKMVINRKIFDTFMLGSQFCSTYSLCLWNRKFGVGESRSLFQNAVGLF